MHDFVAEGFRSMLVQIAQAFLNLLFTPDVIQADGQPVSSNKKNTAPWSRRGPVVFKLM